MNYADFEAYNIIIFLQIWNQQTSTDGRITIIQVLAVFAAFLCLWSYENVTDSSYKEAAAADNTQVYYEIKGYFYHGYNH